MSHTRTNWVGSREESVPSGTWIESWPDTDPAVQYLVAASGRTDGGVWEFRRTTLGARVRPFLRQCGIPDYLTAPVVRVHDARMTEPCPASPDVADWMESRLDNSRTGRLGDYVPRGFDRLVRVLHPAGDGRTWAEVAQANGTTVHGLAEWFRISRRPGVSRSSDKDPEEGSVPASVLWAILDHCPGSGEIFQGVWDGFGWWVDAPGPERPARGYYIFATPRAPVHTWPGMDPLASQSANRIWPPDHSWFITTDIDLDSTLVAGSSSLAEALLADDRLETFELSYDDELNLWSDRINPPPAYLRPRPGTGTS